MKKALLIFFVLKLLVDRILAIVVMLPIVLLVVLIGLLITPTKWCRRNISHE